MLGNFTYCNPTKLYFGKDAVENLRTELKNYGKNILLVYGGGSVKKNGIYDRVMTILKECGKEVTEDAGVMPNPTTHKLYEGIARARACQADLILAVGGGSVCDYAKAVSVSVHCDEDPWEKYFLRFEEPTCAIVPVACVLTMVGQRDERRLGHHQSRAEAQDRSRLRNGGVPQVLRARSDVHLHASALSDGVGDLRYFQPYLRTVLLWDGRQYERLSLGRAYALAHPFQPYREQGSHEL